MHVRMHIKFEKIDCWIEKLHLKCFDLPIKVKMTACHNIANRDLGYRQNDWLIASEEHQLGWIMYNCFITLHNSGVNTSTWVFQVKHILNWCAFVLTLDHGQTDFYCYLRENNKKLFKNLPWRWLFLHVFTLTWQTKILFRPAEGFSF